MSEQLKESLSAVIDGEADEFEIRRVLNEAANDPSCAACGNDIHLVRSVMRGEGRKLAVANLERAILDADRRREMRPQSDAPVETIDVPSVARERLGPMGSRVAGVAVAAGVAAAVVSASAATKPRRRRRAADRVGATQRAMCRPRRSRCSTMKRVADGIRPRSICSARTRTCCTTRITSR